MVSGYWSPLNAQSKVTKKKKIKHGLHVGNTLSGGCGKEYFTSTQNTKCVYDNMVCIVRENAELSLTVSELSLTAASFSLHLSLPYKYSM